MNKFCKSCNSEKNVSEFYVRRNRGNGLAGYTHKCKSCLRKTSREYNTGDGFFHKSEYNKKYREKHRDKLNEYCGNWRVDIVNIKHQLILYINLEGELDLSYLFHLRINSQLNPKKQ